MHESWAEAGAVQSIGSISRTGVVSLQYQDGYPIAVNYCFPKLPQYSNNIVYIAMYGNRMPKINRKCIKIKQKCPSIV